jgi:hypothetical protein
LAIRLLTNKQHGIRNSRQRMIESILINMIINIII